MMGKICVVTTTPFIANTYLRAPLEMLASRYDVTLATNLRDSYALDASLAARMRVIHVPIERRCISPHCDLVVLARLMGLYLRESFSAVHSVAPKAGLLAMASASVSRVPVRIHTFQGEVWVTRRGPRRYALKAADRLVARLVTHALVVSRSEQAFLEQERVLPRNASTVLGSGSIAGVDCLRFCQDPQARSEVRSELGLSDDRLLVVYVGRLTREKGVMDLGRAFAAMKRSCPQATLLFVGPDEQGLRACLEGRSGDIRFVGYTVRPERYLASADIVCLPSHREGFGLALIEAGACAVPVVAARVYGMQDTVVDGVTGLFHEPGNAEDLCGKLLQLAADRDLRQRLGQAARARVEAQFSQSRVVDALREYYAHILA